MMDDMQRYQIWLDSDIVDQATKDELLAIKDDPEAIKDRFWQDLTFGTGGLRGLIGAGTSRMNPYTVARATHGLAAWLLQESSQPSCVIAYDSRIGSDVFAAAAAAVLASHRIRVHLFPELVPTPVLSFAVRHLGCRAGIMITASHNPASYNGYKVYDHTGCQITLEAAEAIYALIRQTPLLPGDRLDRLDSLLASGAVTPVSSELLDAYYSYIMSLSVNPVAAGLRIVYSPLNGTGNKPVREVLGRLNLVQVHVVPEQEQPDGHFPTCPRPNPENAETMQLAIALARSLQAELCLATDPDCDRIGAAVILDQEARLINGNEMGVLLLDYICRSRISQGTMPERPVAVKTIVTTEMASAIASHYGVELRQVLTGFKFIGDQIVQLAEAGEEDRFIFGFEESYGYLSGTTVRDKDAVNAALLICEMAAYYKARRMTLLDALEDLCRQYGYYASGLVDMTCEGHSGLARIQMIMHRLRTSPPNALDTLAVTGMIDYMAGYAGLPPADVVRFQLQDGSDLVVRPSGTEPKLKVYLTAKGTSRAESEAVLQRIKNACIELLEALEES